MRGVRSLLALTLCALAPYLLERIGAREAPVGSAGADAPAWCLVSQKLPGAARLPLAELSELCCTLAP